MRRTVGVLYILTGLLCKLAYLSSIGAMHALKLSDYAVVVSLIDLLQDAGLSLLVLAGAAMLFEHVSRGGLCLITGSAVVATLAAWTVPSFGWTGSNGLVLGTEAASFLIASSLVLILKRRWILAVIGSVVPAPFFLLLAGYMVSALMSGAHAPPLTQFWFLAPATLMILSFVSALWFRTV